MHHGLVMSSTDCSGRNVSLILLSPTIQGHNLNVNLVATLRPDVVEVKSLKLFEDSLPGESQETSTGEAYTRCQVLEADKDEYQYFRW